MSKAPLGVLMRVEQVVETVAAALTGLSALLIFVGVVLRNLFSISPAWVIEAPIYTFVWAAFLVLGGTFQRGLHLGLDVIVAALPASLQRAFAIFSIVAMIIIAATLMWLGLALSIEQFEMGAATNTALQMPLYLVTAAMPVGFALLLLRGLVDLAARKYREAPNPAPTEAGL